MALKDLRAQLKEFRDFVEDSDALREVTNRATWQFHFSEASIKKQVREIRNKFISSTSGRKRHHEAGDRPTNEKGFSQKLTTGKGSRLSREDEGYENAPLQFAFGPGDDKLLTDFSQRFFSELYSNCQANLVVKETAHTVFTISKTGKDIWLIAKAKPEKTPSVYAAVTRIIQKTEQTLFKEPKWAEIFSKGSQVRGGSSVFNLGHVESIAATKAATVQQFVADAYNKLPKDAAAAYDKKVQKVTGAIPLEMQHGVKVNFRNGTLTGKFVMLGDIQSFDENMKGVAHDQETALGRAIYAKGKKGAKGKGLVQELIDDIERDLVSNLLKVNTEEELSTPFLTMLGGMFTQLPSIKRLQKLGVAINYSKYKIKPKTKKPISAKDSVTVKHTNTTVEVSDLLGAAHMKGGKKKGQGMQGGQASRAPQNLAQLPALINMKLGDKIISNMGDPALVNRTGAFASSVRVAAATSTASGVPNFDYTYNKNPYEVFELGGRGRQPWATTGRDPRNIIEKSIREIATEMALGALTLRRV